MARLLNRPIRVLALRGGAPAAFVVLDSRHARGDPGASSGGRARRVRRTAAVLDEWREAGRWWAGEGEKSVYRLLLEDGAVCEVERDEATGRWSLYKVYD